MSSLLGGERQKLEPKVKLYQPAIGSVGRKHALTSVFIVHCKRGALAGAPAVDTFTQIQQDLARD
jgi:hypothetical protein